VAQRLAVPLHVTLGVSALGVVLAAAGGVWLARNAGTRDIIRRLDEMQAEVSAWQMAHRARIRGLERRMTDIEISVMCAEEDAHTAATQMTQIGGNLLSRLEQVEQRMEIQLLVDQGRIPREHLPEPGTGW
jgi:UPF0716 family protein affecting phage T7 exclusion